MKLDLRFFAGSRVTVVVGAGFVDVAPPGPACERIETRQAGNPVA